MFIIQNFFKKIIFLQILDFLKNSSWNFKFSYIFRLSPLCMNEEKWKKSQEIKFYWDLFSNSVPTVLEQKFEFPLAWSLWVIFGPQIGYEP